MIDFIKNHTVFANKYRTYSEAIIVACYFNPQNSAYRLKAFKEFYESIKHLNHSIIECVIGDTQPQLTAYPGIKQIKTDNLLWHKEGLLNKLIAELPTKYKYIFWIDADVLFTNKNWLVEGVKELKTHRIIQPFEYCVHLNQDVSLPKFPDNFNDPFPNRKNKYVWRSFCANYTTNPDLAASEIYNDHGHVGFAWGARRSALDITPLYDKALIGGADHIMAHAAAGHIPHLCITKSFSDDIDAVNDWSRQFYANIHGSIGYVKGNLYHIWHGDTNKRQYLKRIQDFTPETKNIIERDSNGLYITKKGDSKYIKDYFKEREVPCIETDDDVLISASTGKMTSAPKKKSITLTPKKKRITQSQTDYHRHDDTDDNFLVSAAVGYMIADNLLNSDSNYSEQDVAGGEFSGGESGGGGAESSWDANNENFS